AGGKGDRLALFREVPRLLGFLQGARREGQIGEAPRLKRWVPRSSREGQGRSQLGHGRRPRMGEEEGEAVVELRQGPLLGDAVAAYREGGAGERESLFTHDETEAPKLKEEEGPEELDALLRRGVALDRRSESIDDPVHVLDPVQPVVHPQLIQ